MDDEIIERGNLYYEKFSDKLAHGKVYQEFENNKIYNGILINGRPHEIWNYWYDNGQKRQQTIFINGIKNGMEYIWYPNGRLQLEGNWVDDGRHGWRFEWYEDGRKKSESFHDWGEIISSKSWDEDGSLADVWRKK